MFLQSLPDERFQQQEEKMQQLRQDLRRVQNLCSSAERELRYEREKNVDLQKQNLLLQQECTKVRTEQGALLEESITSFYKLWEVWGADFNRLDLIYVWLYITWGLKRAFPQLHGNCTASK